MSTPSIIRMKVFFWILGAALGLSQAWVARWDIVNDTVSYLDMGNYFFHGHPWSIINGVWSPLYAMCLGLAMFIFRPSPHWEYPLVHLMLFLVFLFTMACFDYFLSQMMQLRARVSSSGEVCEAGSVWIAIGYTIFLWCSLDFIGVNESNPDMIVAAFFYLICGLLIQISAGSTSRKVFLALGFILGLSYLTKGVMFPISILVLGASFLLAKQRYRDVVAAAIVWIVISSPFIALLSAKEGRLSFGETGTYNYAVHVNRIPWRHWQGDSRNHLLHPTHQIFALPATFEFAEPLEGTYPVWFDPSYWYQGVELHFAVGEQFKTLAVNLFYQFQMLFWGLNGTVVASLLFMFSVGKRKWLIPGEILKYWFLIVPSLAALMLYALVHFEPRYIAPFFVVLTLCGFFSVVFPDGFPKRRFLSAVAVLLFVMFSGLTVVPVLHSLVRVGKNRKPSYQETAEAAYALGLRPGDSIASLNMSNLGVAMWAHLAGVRIIAEVYYWQPGRTETLANNFWHADPSKQENVLEALAQTGAKAVISQDEPTGAKASEWRELGKTGYYLRWLKSTDPRKAKGGGEDRRQNLSSLVD